MPDRIPAMMTLLEDLRRGQAAGNELLNDVRVSVAGLERSHEGQAQQLARIEATVDQLSDRVRFVEINHARIPQLERELAQVDERVKIGQETANRRHTDLDTRVRALEGDGRETKVVTGSAREIFWRIFSAAAGAGAVLLVDAIRHAG
jgi:outer membrane murein-binding lipoprotein Lpp